MFKIGDRVRCVDNCDGLFDLTIGGIYEIELVTNCYIYVKSDTGNRLPYSPHRFNLATQSKNSTTIDCYTDPDFASKMPLGLHLENPHGTLTKVRVTIEKVEESREEKLVGLGLDTETVGKIMEIFNEV